MSAASASENRISSITNQVQFLIVAKRIPSARKVERRSLDLLKLQNVGIEFMAAAQALDFREYEFGNGVTKAKEVVRRHVEFLDIDRPLYNDHNSMKDLVKSCEILIEVENVVGSLQ